MQLVETHQFNYNHKYYKQLDHLCWLSKNLYNATLYAVRQHYFKTNQYLSYYDVNKQFAHNNQYDYRQLPAKVSQMIQRLVDQNFKSFFTLLQKKQQKLYDKPVKIPKYLKKDGKQVVQYPRQALSFKKTGYIKLSGTDIFIKTKIQAANIQAANIQAARIIPCNGYIKVEIIYKTIKSNIKKNNKFAAIDLGINNLMTITSTEFNPLIINGKPLKSINQHANKLIAKCQQSLAKYNLYISKYLHSIYRKRMNKINDYLHKSVSYLMNQLVSHDISTLIVGYNKEWKQDIKLGKRNNQTFVQIPYYRLICMLEYKCELYGIKLILHEESYTSKCSFLDKEAICKHSTYLGKRIKRGLFQTKENKLINADVNGSLNIMRKVVGNNIYNMLDLIQVCSIPYKITIKKQ